MLITALLGVFNGLFLTFYFLWGKSKAGYQNIYLGLMLLALVIRIGKSVFYYFNRTLDEAYIMIGLMACVAIGPMSYYFVRSQITGDKRFNPKSLFSLAPILLLLGYAYFFDSYWENKWLWSVYILRGIYLYWGIFSIYAAYLLFVNRGDIRKKYWTTGIMCGVLLIWLTYMTSTFTSYLAGAITFTFLVYLLVWLLFARGETETKSRKSKSKGIWSEIEVSEIKEKIERVLVEEDRYKDASLTMPVLAREVSLTPHQLSLFVNDHLNQNFSQLINEVRIEAAKHKLLQEQHLTVEAIAFDCGFNATSTFHTAFKNITGMTPSAFRKQASVSSVL